MRYDNIIWKRNYLFSCIIIPYTILISMSCTGVCTNNNGGGIGFTYDPADGEIRELMSQLYLDDVISDWDYRSYAHHTFFTIISNIIL